jgi:capsular polysaccharide transport system permease protein
MPEFTTDDTSARDFWHGLRVQARCVHALIIRDMMMRYGRDNIGFLWVVFEPMILTVGVMMVWSILKPSYEHGVQIISLVLTGYMPLTLQRHMSNAGIFIFRRNAGLLYHRNITLIDTFASRMFLEFAGTTTALFVVTASLVAFGLVPPPRDLLLVSAAWILMGTYAFGLGLIFAALTEYSEVTERFIQPYQYLQIPISGTFFMVEWLPYFAQTLIWYNPTVHCYEMFRAGFFDENVRTHYTVWYPFVWAVGLISVGIWGVDKIRDKLHYG